jgi:hypothetical protein
VRTLFALFALASSVTCAWPSAASAQARELGRPTRGGEARAWETALPRSPGPGFVPVALEGDEARALHVVERRRGQDRAVCIAPCARWLEEGVVRLGIGDAVGPRWWSGPIRLREATTFELHYVDNALTRALGFGLLVASLVTIGAAGYDFLDQGATDPPAVTMVVAGLALGVSFGLFFVGDGMDIRPHAGLSELE